MSNEQNLKNGKMDQAGRWKGGTTEWGGYRFIKTLDHPNAPKNNYIAEHRLVMEKHIGRYLLPKEAVHHINHNTLDNRIENLQLFSSHGQHTAIAHPEVFVRNKYLKIRKCVNCQKDFEYTWETLRKITCSLDCKKMYLSKKYKGKHLSPKSEFVKGMTPWNKGLKK